MRLALLLHAARAAARHYYTGTSGEQRDGIRFRGRALLFIAAHTLYLRGVLTGRVRVRVRARSDRARDLGVGP